MSTNVVFWQSSFSWDKNLKGIVSLSVAVRQLAGRILNLSRTAYSLSASQIANDLLLPLWFFYELPHDVLNGSHAKPVSPIDKRGATLELLDEVAQEAMVLVMVYLLDAPFRHNTAAVCLETSLVYKFFPLLRMLLKPTFMMESSRFSRVEGRAFPPW